ncbi:MAG: acyloxyacyl hydrolase [Rhodanobacter sp.]
MASLLAPAFPAIAAHIEVQAGRSYTDNKGSAAVFVEGVLDEHQLGRTSFTWAPDVSLGWIEGHDINGFRHDRYDPRKGVLLVAAGARFHYGVEGAWYRPLFFSFQPALANRRTLALGTPYEFVSTLGWQGQRFSFQIRHISNGDLGGPNRGETMALVGIGFDL